MKRKDVNQIAFETLQKAIGVAPKDTREDRKLEAAELGRKGGLKGGANRAATLSIEQRKAIAQKAAKARWKNKKP